ncbi:MAG TPA: glycosyltransferase family protein [Ignavibacteria bacterium]|nr:glycosyltransferase family protein [Ignavibacteria bacterium]HMR38854.1 glycosyltransferase family protein [Ignavibacteria bacterium]
MSNTAFIAARMGSERMPGKVLKELAGIPSLVHIFNILNESKLVDDYAVLTSILSEDDVIADLCEKHNVKVFRGPVNDVLGRFRIAGEELKPERIIRVTGDDPLMDPEIIDKVISEHMNGDYDYSSNMVERTYPRGMDTEVIEYKAMESCWNGTFNDIDEDDREHVTLFIRRHPEIFSINSVKNEGESNEDIRLCLDTEEDADLLTEIFRNLYKNRPIRLPEILDFLKNNPELRNINSNIQQKPVKGKVY